MKLPFLILLSLVLMTGCASQAYIDSVGVAQWQNNDRTVTCYSIGAGAHGAAAISCLHNLTQQQ